MITAYTSYSWLKFNQLVGSMTALYISLTFSVTLFLFEYAVASLNGAMEAIIIS
jgi:hypothetical protein